MAIARTPEVAELAENWTGKQGALGCVVHDDAAGREAPWAFGGRKMRGDVVLLENKPA